jgi:T5SS/PEP-CTERM-associated repeat protein
MKKTTIMKGAAAGVLVALVSVSNAAITAESWTLGVQEANDWENFEPNSGGPSPYAAGDDFYVGTGGGDRKGILTIDLGSEVSGGWCVLGRGNASNSGEVTVTGAGSLFDAWETLQIGEDNGDPHSSILNIADSGLVKAVGLYIAPTAVVQMTGGGQLALDGVATDTLANFLGDVDGTSASLMYWNGSAWASMTAGTKDTDYTLEDGTGDLAGYGVLTAIAPVTGGATPGTVFIIK